MQTHFRCVILVCAILLAGLLAGCSSPAPAPTQPAARATPASTKASDNPVAKYIELVGFRISEKGPGKLTVRFGVVNHSDADIGDLEMTVNIRTTTAKATDPPLFSFPVKVTALGPESLKETEVETATKLRIYELPDWQFLRSDFVVTAPQ
jgi:hypothetical protein